MRVSFPAAATRRRNVPPQQTSRFGAKRLLFLIGLLCVLVPTALFLRTAPLRRENDLKGASLARLENLSRRSGGVFGGADARVLYYLGRRRRQAGQIALAYEAFRRSAERDPDDENNWLALVDTAGAVAGESVPLTLLNDFVQRHPEGVPVRLALGALYERNHAYQRADEEAKTVLRTDPKNADAWRIVGRAAIKMQDLPAAEAALRKAVAFGPNDWRNHAGLGDFLVDRGRYDEALAQYRVAVGEAPGEPVPVLSLGRALLKSVPAVADASPATVAATTLDESRKHLEQVRARWPVIPQTYLLLAQTYLRQRRWAEARPLLEQSARLDPQGAETQNALHQVYLRLGQREAAVRAARRHDELTRYTEQRRDLFQRLAQVGPDAPENRTLRLQLARLLVSGREEAAAAGQYRQILAHFPGQPDARRELAALAPWGDNSADELLEMADALRAQKKFGGALRAYRATLERDRSRAAAYEGLGLTLQATGEITEAVLCFREAIQRDTGRTRARRALADLYTAAQMDEEASRCLQKAVAAAPQDASLWNALGRALQHFPLKSDEAEAAFANAVARNDGSVDFLLDLAESQAASKPVQAEALFRRALALAPRDPAARARLGAFLANTAAPNSPQLREARELLRSALALDPKDDFARYHLGRIVLDQGEAKQAVALLEAALTRPQNRDAQEVWYTLSRACRANGQKVRADQAAGVASKLQQDFLRLQQAREQVTMTPRDLSRRLVLARLQEDRGDNMLSLANLEYCLRLDPGNSAARRALEALKQRLKKQNKMPPMDLFRALVAAAAADDAQQRP